MKRYIPRVGQHFRAFLKVEKPGKEHCGSPFFCTEVTKASLSAKDKNGLICQLHFADFSFNRIER